MSDMNLLLFGIVVFGLMVIGMGFTVAEFRRLSTEEKSGIEAQSDGHDSSGRTKNRP
jgi:hypothetical protein